MSLKLNVLLAKTEHAAAIFKKMVAEYTNFFKKEQGQFRGAKRTYEARPGVVDDPSMRGITKVVTTVKEKLVWFEENAAEFINHTFSVEATNASGKARAKLVVVDGGSTYDFGELSSLELLRLKSFLESSDLEPMYAAIPVRSDAEIWAATQDSEYAGRDIFESPLQKGIKKSIFKEAYILQDPNIKELRDAAKYVPQVAQKDSVLELGDYTAQLFSGESTHRDRAEILQRRSKFLAAVIEALKIANEAEVVTSSLTAEKIFSYLHGKK